MPAVIEVAVWLLIAQVDGSAPLLPPISLVWVTTALAIVVAGGLVLETNRRTTYNLLLTNIPPGGILLDTDRHGRQILVVRGYPPPYIHLPSEY